MFHYEAANLLRSQILLSSFRAHCVGVAVVQRIIRLGKLMGGRCHGFPVVFVALLICALLSSANCIYVRRVQSAAERSAIAHKKKLQRNPNPSKKKNRNHESPVISHSFTTSLREEKLAKLIAAIASQDRSSKVSAGTLATASNDCLSCKEARKSLLTVQSYIDDIIDCVSVPPHDISSAVTVCNVTTTSLKFDVTNKYMETHLLGEKTYYDVPKFKNNIDLAYSIYKRAQPTCLQIYDTDYMFKFKREACNRKLKTCSNLLQELTSATLGQHFTANDVKVVAENSVETAQELYQDIEKHDIFNAIKKLDRIDYDLLALEQLSKYIDSPIFANNFKTMIDKTGKYTYS